MFLITVIQVIIRSWQCCTSKTLFGNDTVEHFVFPAAGESMRARAIHVLQANVTTRCGLPQTFPGASREKTVFFHFSRNGTH